MTKEKILEFYMWDEVKSVFPIKKHGLKIAHGVKDGKELFMLYTDKQPIMTADSPNVIRAYIRKKYGSIL